VARVQSAANELEKCLQRPSTIADLTLALDNVAEKLTQLKRKVSIEKSDIYDIDDDYYFIISVIIILPSALFCIMHLILLYSFTVYLLYFYAFYSFLSFHLTLM